MYCNRRTDGRTDGRTNIVPPSDNLVRLAETQKPVSDDPSHWW